LNLEARPQLAENRERKRPVAEVQGVVVIASVSDHRGDRASGFEAKKEQRATM